MLYIFIFCSDENVCIWKKKEEYICIMIYKVQIGLEDLKQYDLLCIYWI